MTTIFTAPDRKVAIVTGGARGIGAAIAVRLAADGHDVAVFDLDVAACTETVRTIEATGRSALALAVDVSSESAVVEGVARVAETLGAPTVLINNAGILRDRTLAKMSLDDWEVVMAVNLRSVFLMCRAVQPHMRAARWGRIVNLSSIAALGVAGEANYAAAKAGVQGITRTLAIELGRHGITANAVAPGFVVTDMTRAVAARMNMPFDDMVAEMMAGIHVGRPGAPDDIAQAVAFFADERSGFVTGQVLYVAGAPRG
ncbi:SDR family oxidoreductase [Sphingomonas sp. AAP5]|uniref:SDR family oxidoreductase n=1 Tax=Sphingomonas sp. AAP5 TaxID=1523415 RepID=UPI0010572FA7|nr:SDR family oxidoreductase [Sphingomonas sp. AAP5]QBM76595.1 SDR family oxidoreductase [Sphingomonas sp. AAP5]